ncbi:hypothetical protein SAMN04489724_2431 [Algoriphagus locisalis]|uniref:Four-helix bundle copper-binding protein n=1 Tax=Algoriphagus locisalis TaxID=305507 RepID=A0A1I7BHI9_9BACT|nr:hypothetical protein SAMN04489724_2431 [Algoriphagus locisalis]
MASGCIFVFFMTLILSQWELISMLILSKLLKFDSGDQLNSIIMSTVTKLTSNLIGSCEQCIDACLSCIDSCKDRPGMGDCIKYCERCIDACKDCISVNESSSLDRAIAMQQCVDACYNCAKECEKHEHEACIKCAEACRNCLTECESLLA